MSVSVEQFRWIDDNPEKDSCEFCSVYLIEDRIAISTVSNDTTIGVVAGPMDTDPAWATIQINGRAFVYRTNYKPPNWILIKKDAKQGPYGPIDEYFIR